MNSTNIKCVCNLSRHNIEDKNVYKTKPNYNSEGATITGGMRGGRS